MYVHLVVWGCSECLYLYPNSDKDKDQASSSEDEDDDISGLRTSETKMEVDQDGEYHSKSRGMFTVWPWYDDLRVFCV